LGIAAGDTRGAGRGACESSRREQKSSEASATTAAMPPARILPGSSHVPSRIRMVSFKGLRPDYP